jgi:NAD-dependent deacetylase sirtuin 4
VDQCDSLLVIGTSLEVFSAYRFVDRANKLKIPIAIINSGETRAERQKLEMIRYKSDENCSQLLSSLFNQLPGIHGIQTLNI